MFRSIGGFRGDSSLSTWAYTIARSFCIKKRRRSKFAPKSVISLDEDPERAKQIADPSRGPDDALESRRLEAAFDGALAALRPSQREVLVLRDIEGLSAAEVAEVLGIRVPAVKSRLHRARSAVREQLAPLYGLAPHPAQAAGCPDIVARFSRYLEGEIRPSACAELQRHIDDCRPCREACESLKHTLGLCQAVPAPRVPEALQESIREQIRRLIESDPQLSSGRRGTTLKTS
jgi:RNA polymerase sigma-70 factor (ECF subfamily)